MDYYTRNNANMVKNVVLEITEAVFPGAYWQIDSTDLPSKERSTYILVLIGTFSGWSEAYPCRTNTARELVKVFLN